MKFKVFLIILFLLLSGGMLFGDVMLNRQNAWYQFQLNYENGFIKVLSHTIQIGSGTTNFDYVKQGGQEILFPFQRFSVDLTLFRRHAFSFLYQPLTIETETRLRQPITIDDTTFDPAVTQGLFLKYGFPFWRASYMFNILNSQRALLGVGISLQLRNASIIFKGTEGPALTVSQNLGPVPILKLKARYNFTPGFYVATEIDGFYASSRLFNGADFEFEGSILDASLRLGFQLNDPLSAFVNVRILGGSAKGTSNYDTDFWSESIEKATQNYLSTLILSLGFSVR